METLDTDKITALVRSMAEQARQAALELACLSTERKNHFLRKLAVALRESQHELIEENKLDLEAGRLSELGDAMLDRLALTPERIEAMAKGVEEVADLPDPVGEEMERVVRPNGLEIAKVRVPIGVIGIIYESRPNVTIDCAALCFKSGNAAILRGGKEAFHSNTALARILSIVLESEGLPAGVVQLIPTTDRYALNTLLKLDQYVHCIIPRGGESLIRFVAENSSIPVIKHYKGVCSLYLHADAEEEMASSLVINAKCQRPGVCNAIENLWVHEEVAKTQLPQLARALVAEGVELRGDEAVCRLLTAANVDVKLATEEDFETEYHDRILAIGIVDSVDQAIAQINRYGSGHSDGIVTPNETIARHFLTGVDGATVYWNASTRFTDGYEFGLGAEIGISTDRLHARGPMGLKELCSYKFIVYGTGQIRS